MRNRAAAIIAAVALAAGPAWAQDAGREAEESGESSSGTTLEVDEVPQVDTSLPSQPVIFLDEVAVTATRSEKTLLETPKSVNVITRGDMDTFMMVNIQDLVRYTPGVTVSRGFGADPFKQLNGFNIRGVGGNRILMLVDGNRIGDQITDGTRNFVDLSLMKQVEIVRGPNSMLWGSDAMGGTVAYETLDPVDLLARSDEPWAFDANVTYSSVNRSWNESVIGAVQLGKVEALLGYSRWDAHEPKLTKGRSPDGIWACTRSVNALPCNGLDPLDQSSNGFLGKLVLPTDSQTLTLTGEYYDQKINVDQLSVIDEVSSGYATKSYVQDQDLTRWRVSLDQQWNAGLAFADSIEWQATYQPQQVESSGTRLRESTATGVWDELTKERSYAQDFIEFETQLNKQFGLFGAVSNNLIYGLDFSYKIERYSGQDVTVNQSTGAVTINDRAGFFFADANTLRLDGFVQNEFGFFGDRLILTPGLRYSYTQIDPRPQSNFIQVAGFEPVRTDYSDLLFAVSLLYKVDENISLYSSYGQGFKTPTASQLYTFTGTGGNFSQVPNPNLEPEEVWSVEVGARAAYDWGAFSLTGFYSDYTNFIAGFQFVPGPDPDTTYITSLNLSKVKIWGIEATGEVALPYGLSAISSLSWTQADQKASPTASWLPYNNAQPFTIVSGLRWAEPDIGLGMELMWTYEAGLRRVSSDADLTTSGYHVFDFVGSWQPYPWVTLRGGVFNIFDVRYIPASAIAAYSTPAVPSTAVASGNPIEARVAPGTNFSVTLSLAF